MVFKQKERNFIMKVTEFRTLLLTFGFKFIFKVWQRKIMMYSVHHFTSALIGLCNTTLLKRAATHSNMLLYVGENVWSKLKHSSNKKCWTNAIIYEFQTTNKTASLVVSVLVSNYHTINNYWDSQGKLAYPANSFRAIATETH